MIAVDTNVLARFYVDDPDDDEAGPQRLLARELIEAGVALFVPITVIVELEWVARSFYQLAPAQFARIVRAVPGRVAAEFMAGPHRRRVLDELFRRMESLVRPGAAAGRAVLIRWRVTAPDGGDQLPVAGTLESGDMAGHIGTNASPAKRSRHRGRENK